MSKPTVPVLCGITGQFATIALASVFFEEGYLLCAIQIPSLLLAWWFALRQRPFVESIHCAAVALLGSMLLAFLAPAGSLSSTPGALDALAGIMVAGVSLPVWFLIDRILLGFSRTSPRS